MKYTVVWLPRAERSLTQIWSMAADQQAVADAADAMDRMLARSPWDVGESRQGDVRILLEKPLGILYRILSPDHLVEVGHVWRYR